MYLVFLYITWHKSTPNLLYDIIRNIAVIIPERGEYGGSR